MEPNMIGAYGPWAAGARGRGPGPALVPQPAVSARRPRLVADPGPGAAQTCLLQPDSGGVPKAQVQHQLEYDGLHVEHLTWQLPYGPPTEAYFLKPAKAEGRLPAVLGLHDHGGNKYFGARKIAQISDDLHPMMKEHRQEYYGGVSWANELAKRGLRRAGPRRLRVRQPPGARTPTCRRSSASDRKEVDPESEDEIEAYNKFAGDHEDIMAKSLFSAGTTWPGVFTAEDQRALDYLCAGPTSIPTRVGCAGLSGGGLRTAYLAGPRRSHPARLLRRHDDHLADYLLNKCYTHTWMIYIPGLPPTSIIPRSSACPPRADAGPE